MKNEWIQKEERMGSKTLNPCVRTILSRVVFCFREEGGNKFTLRQVESEVPLRHPDRVSSSADGDIGLEIGRKVWVVYSFVSQSFNG